MKNIRLLILITFIFGLSGCSSIFGPTIEDTILEKNNIKTTDEKNEKKLWNSLIFNYIHFAIKKDHPSYKEIKNSYLNYVANSLTNNSFKNETYNLTNTQVGKIDFCKKSSRGDSLLYNQCMDNSSYQQELSMIKKLNSLYAKRITENNVEYVYIKIPTNNRYPNQPKNLISFREYVFAFIEPENSNTAYLLIGYTHAFEPNGYSIIFNQIYNFEYDFLNKYNASIPIRLIPNKHIDNAKLYEDGYLDFNGSDEPIKSKKLKIDFRNVNW